MSYGLSASPRAIFLELGRHGKARNLHLDRAQVGPTGEVQGLPVLAAKGQVGGGGRVARCPFRKSCASALLGAPGSSPAPKATLERGAPREPPWRTGSVFMKQTSSSTVFMG